MKAARTYLAANPDRQKESAPALTFNIIFGKCIGVEFTDEPPAAPKQPVTPT